MQRAILFFTVLLNWVNVIVSQSDDFMGNFLPEGVNVEKMRRKQDQKRLNERKFLNETNIPMNQEMVVIDAGKSDPWTILGNRKKLLCVMFLKAEDHPLSTLTQNMDVMREACDWAAVFYDGGTTEINSYCSLATEHLKTTLTSELVYCKRAKDTLDRPLVMISTKQGTFLQQPLSVPKSALYAELLPYLPHYENVFLMDEDISLQGFDLARFMRIWKCSFGSDHRPLIVQPLIAERTQYFPYVHVEAWARARGKVFAASVGLVEQQVPFFDATFFAWFVKHVLAHTRGIGLVKGVDQSLDRTWCLAANMFALHLMNQNYTNKGNPCAVIIGGNITTAVHHLNTRSLENKKANRGVYRQKAREVHELYSEMYPSWIQQDITRGVNPLDRKKNGKKYRLYSGISKNCVASFDANSTQVERTIQNNILT